MRRVRIAAWADSESDNAQEIVQQARRSDVLRNEVITISPEDTRTLLDPTEKLAAIHNVAMEIASCQQQGIRCISPGLNASRKIPMAA